MIAHKAVEWVLAVGWVIVIFTCIIRIGSVVHLLCVCLQVIKSLDAFLGKYRVRLYESGELEISLAWICNLVVTTTISHLGNFTIDGVLRYRVMIIDVLCKRIVHVSIFECLYKQGDCSILSHKVRKEVITWGYDTVNDVDNAIGSRVILLDKQ